MVLCNSRGGVLQENSRGRFSPYSLLPSKFHLHYPFKTLRAQYFRVECSHGYQSVGNCLAKPHLNRCCIAASNGVRQRKQRGSRHSYCWWGGGQWLFVKSSQEVRRSSSESVDAGVYKHKQLLPEPYGSPSLSAQEVSLVYIGFGNGRLCLDPNATSLKSISRVVLRGGYTIFSSVPIVINSDLRTYCGFFHSENAQDPVFLVLPSLSRFQHFWW